MTKIEKILENWKWDEEKIKKYLEEFEKYLNSKKGESELEKRRKKLLMVQKFLKDEESIDKLSSEDLKEILKIVDTLNAVDVNFSRVVSKIEKDENYKSQIKNWLKDLIKIQEQDQLPKGPENLTAKTASELLTFRYPEKFYIVNGASIKGLNELRSVNLSDELKDSHINERNYPKFRPLFEYLKDKINKVIEEKLGKRADYYDVDHFLYFISEQNKESEKNKTDESQEKYKESSNITETDRELESVKQTEVSKLTLQQYFQYKGFYFDQDLITAFYSALKTKGFVILLGLTGTGKTKMAQLFAELLCPICNPPDKQNTQIAQTSSKNQNQSNCTHLFLSVRPDWRDSKALLGYYNPITGNYEGTPLLDFILKAMDDYNRANKNANPYFVILDEMNLSHVEYYFADFLSVLESGRDQHGWTKETIKLHNVDPNNVKESKESNLPPEEINLPPNLYIIGSVNIDETTYMFSPKVLDRAFTIEFREVNLDSYLKSLKNGPNNISEDELKILRDTFLNDLRNNGKFCAAVADKEEIKKAINELDSTIKDELNKLNKILQLYDLHFGYRVLDEIALFIKYATNAPKEVGELQLEQALDFAVLMKVLPKFHGPRQKLERPLWLVLKWCLENSEIKNGDDLVNAISENLNDLKKKIWKSLKNEEKDPKTEDLIEVIQKLMQELKLNEANEGASQKDNTQSQTSGKNQSQTIEETQEGESDHTQTENKTETKKLSIINKVKYPRTAIKVLTMLRQLYETGFGSFA